MAKYIKADELSRAKFHPLPYTHITPADIKDKEAYERGWNDAIDAIIESAPTADVAEVVRCKDCVHLVRSEGVCRVFSNNYEPPVYVDDDDFCSRCERREDERPDRTE